jgi:hypothetical protein
MSVRKYLVALLAVSMLLAMGGTAGAAFPDHTGCPTSTPNFEFCLDVQAQSGNLRIKDFNVPLGPSLEIRGAIRNENDVAVLVPPTGTNGFFARPVPVPGGLLGIEWIPGNTVLAITELAGPTSAIRIDFQTFTIRLPIKVRLENLLLGMNCHIGSNTNPVNLNLIVGTTSPPPPNTPISGTPPTLSFEPTTNEIRAIGARNVENSFAVPGATSCGLGLGLINTLVNLKLKLPSAAGNNSIEVVNNIAIRLP